MSDPYEREAAKAAIHTLQRELAAVRELAESNGKLAHDAAIEAMRYRRELAESNGKLAHDAEIKAMRYREELSEVRKDYNCLAERLNGHDATECRANLDKLIKERDLLIEGLEKLASLDFVITLPDRMDAVREIARETLNKLKP